MSNLNRRQQKAAAEVERLVAGLFEALDLALDYDTINIRRGDNTTFGPWVVTIDNTNRRHGERVLRESGRTLAEALSAVVGQAARAHVIASGNGRSAL